MISHNMFFFNGVIGKSAFFGWGTNTYKELCSIFCSYSVAFCKLPISWQEFLSAPFTVRYKLWRPETLLKTAAKTSTCLA